MLVLVGGIPASGKSTLADAIAPDLWLNVVSGDADRPGRDACARRTSAALRPHGDRCLLPSGGAVTHGWRGHRRRDLVPPQAR
ncbi:MAG: hypothetical protein FJ033_08910 [Chloroflexi bacterium]|nr:hypothetical protein [Chloroflexota bacterium]